MHFFGAGGILRRISAKYGQGRDRSSRTRVIEELEIIKLGACRGPDAEHTYLSEQADAWTKSEPKIRQNRVIGKGPIAHC